MGSFFNSFPFNMSPPVAPHPHSVLAPGQTYQPVFTPEQAPVIMDTPSPLKLATPMAACGCDDDAYLSDTSSTSPPIPRMLTFEEEVLTMGDVERLTREIDALKDQLAIYKQAISIQMAAIRESIATHDLDPFLVPSILQRLDMLERHCFGNVSSHR